MTSQRGLRLISPRLLFLQGQAYLFQHANHIVQTAYFRRLLKQRLPRVSIFWVIMSLLQDSGCPQKGVLKKRVHGFWGRTF